MHRLAVGIADSGKQPAPRQRMTLGFSVTDPRGINRAPASEKYQPLQRRAYPDGDLCGHTNCLCAASNSGGRTKTVPNSCTFWFRYFSGTVGTQRVRSICRCGVRYPINGSILWAAFTDVRTGYTYMSVYWIIFLVVGLILSAILLFSGKLTKEMSDRRAVEPRYKTVSRKVFHWVIGLCAAVMTAVDIYHLSKD